jgi:hypothetical protein
VNTAYAMVLAAIPDGTAKTDGITLGQAVAAVILVLRSTDHATTLVAYTLGTQPGDWQPTPNPVPFDPPAAADHKRWHDAGTPPPSAPATAHAAVALHSPHALTAEDGDTGWRGRLARRLQGSKLPPH